MAAQGSHIGLPPELGRYLGAGNMFVPLKRGHWWTEWASAWGYIPSIGAGDEDTLPCCLIIPRII